jgi:predicted nucleic acid-binding protein
MKVYIETTVVSYYTASFSRDLVTAGHQQATRDFWVKAGKDFEAYISALVVAEAGKGDQIKAKQRLEAIASFSVLDIDSEAERLAGSIVAGGGISDKFPEDALHIAVAAVNGIDVIVTWNFAHLNNPFTRMMIRQIVENEGYICPEIVSPDELLGEEP